MDFIGIDISRDLEKINDCENRIRHVVLSEVTRRLTEFSDAPIKFSVKMDEKIHLIYSQGDLAHALFPSLELYPDRIHYFAAYVSEYLMNHQIVRIFEEQMNCEDEDVVFLFNKEKFEEHYERILSVSANLIDFDEK